MNTITNKLRAARLMAGKSENDVANFAKITRANYFDLESHANELEMTVSLTELNLICKIIGLTIIDLFAENDKTDISSTVPLEFPELAAKVRQKLVTDRISLAEFEEQAGWEISEFLSDPAKAWDWNIDALRDVSSAAGVDWIAVIKSLK